MDVAEVDIAECALCLNCRECKYYYGCNLPSHDDDDEDAEREE